MKKRTNQGYSLATLAILVAAFSAATVGLMTYTEYAPKANKQVQTHNDINQTLEYVKVFASKTQILPCPADPTLPPTNANYLVSAGTYPNCSSSLPNKGSNYFKGLVPTKTIGIADKYAFDNHHASLTYMVGKGSNYFKVNTNHSCINKDGSLASGCSYTNANQFVQFSTDKEPNLAIISHGADHVGALRKDHSSITPFSKSVHQVQAQQLPNGKYFDSIPQSINHDYYLSGSIDEIIFKPLVSLGNPANTSATPDNVKYDDTVVFARVEVADETIGAVRCWGQASYGGATPSPVIQAKAIFSGNGVMCAIKADNTVQCWGQASYGGTTPSPVIQAKTIVGTSNGNAMCAIKTDNNVQCWGNSGYGGTTPSPVIQAKFITGNTEAMCAIKMDNTVQCWGEADTGGQTPSPAIQAKAISSGDSAMCAVKTDDNVQCWGGYMAGGNTPSPVIQAKSINGNIYAMCAIKTDDFLQCWGGLTSSPPAIQVKSITGNYEAMCAIKLDNTVQCWGEASAGGTTPSPTIQAKSLVNGGVAICAIKLDNTVQCWGNASYGGTTPSPVIQAKSLITGGGAFCAIKMDDTVQCWGEAAAGGTTPSPVIQSKFLAANPFSMCAILK